MICPACNDPMSMARYIPNEAKKFECARCVRLPPRKQKIPGYTGQILISAKAKVNHQERVEVTECER